MGFGFLPEVRIEVWVCDYNRGGYLTLTVENRLIQISPRAQVIYCVALQKVVTLWVHERAEGRQRQLTVWNNEQLRHPLDVSLQWRNYLVIQAFQLLPNIVFGGGAIPFFNVESPGGVAPDDTRFQRADVAVDFLGGTETHVLHRPTVTHDKCPVLAVSLDWLVGIASIPRHKNRERCVGSQFGTQIGEGKARMGSLGSRK